MCSGPACRALRVLFAWASYPKKHSPISHLGCMAYKPGHQYLGNQVEGERMRTSQLSIWTFTNSLPSQPYSEIKSSRFTKSARESALLQEMESRSGSPNCPPWTLSTHPPFSELLGALKPFWNLGVIHFAPWWPSPLQLRSFSQAASERQLRAHDHANILTDLEVHL